MSPDDDKITPANAPAGSPVPSHHGSSNEHDVQSATANIVRAQIEQIYNKTPAEQATPLQEVHPYERNHADHPQPVLEQWKQYHSAWQTYYQKYYEGYYTHHLTKAKQSLDPAAASGTNKEAYFTHRSDEPDTEGLTKDEALFDLRQKLLSKVTDSAKKVRKSRHFIPITAAVLVVLLFVFLQYNRVLVSNVVAYVSPGSIDVQNIVLDPTVDINVGPDPRLIIPKINVDVPVLYDVGSDYNSQMKAMETGVAHFAIPGASSHPGQIGNTVLSGHSSNDLLEAGDYKFIFAQLDKLQVGDSIYLNYQSKRYTYTITKKEVVEPHEVNKLIYPTDKPMLTLITCTPLGTALQRLLVTAEQVSPDPAASAAAPIVDPDVDSAEIPGSTATFLDRLFGS